MISDKFSCARMWALTKRYAVENRRNILITTGVMFGMILLFSIVITKTMDENDIIRINSARSSLLLACYAWIAAIIVQVLGSLTFSSMSTKSKRISNMMLPAAQSEKFVSQCLLYVVGGNLVMVLSFFCADTVSALIFGRVPGWAIAWQTVNELLTCPRNINIALTFLVGFIWLYLFGQAIYVLGSTLWPKKSFLKTFIALFVIQILLPIIAPVNLLIHFFSNIFDWLGNFPQDHIWISLWAVLAVAYVLLAGIYMLAWHRFRRLEIVKRFLN